jgi:hypothetical protein
VLYRITCSAVVFGLFASVSPCQQTPAGDLAQPDVVQKTENNKPLLRERTRILGIIPNYRTSPSLQNYEPMTSREKFKMASANAFDPGVPLLAAFSGSVGQLTNANRSFGQGGAGFGRYFGAAYGDIVIREYMKDAVFPTFLQQDPRYFRRGSGSRRSRLSYAIGQVFWTHRDTGGAQFNYSEVLGNSTAVAISSAYYVNNRTAADAAYKFSIQLGIDMAGNILKEFWPDLERKFRRKHRR